MGIYIGCHCFNMTNGHALSCVAQFIYADLIRPLKWNTQWAICQKLKAYVTASLLQSYSSHVLQGLKLDEYSWLEEIVIQLGKKLQYSEQTLPPPFLSLVIFVCVSCSRKAWKVEKKIFGFRHLTKRRFPRVVSLTTEGVSCSEGHGAQRTGSGEKWWDAFAQTARRTAYLWPFSGPRPDHRVFILLGLCAVEPVRRWHGSFMAEEMLRSQSLTC